MTSSPPSRRPRSKGQLALPLAADPAIPRIHAAGEKRLDAVLDFVRFAVRPIPVSTLLDELPTRIAAILDADVASLYLLEGEGDALVMRGNVGFPDAALGQVRLVVGEGLTGRAVEQERPISVTFAHEQDGYRHFPELGEEKYPVFAAVPVLGRSGPLGAITVQRRRGHAAFGDADIELLVALSATIGAGLRHAELLDALRERSPRRAGGGTRKVTLPGRPVVAGRALGALAALRRPPSRPKAGAGARDDVARLKGAFDQAERALAVLLDRARAERMGAEAGFLQTYVQIVSDARLRGRAAELAADGSGIPHALGQVAREATRAATSMSRDPFLEERARDIEDLCDAVVMIASADPRAALPAKAILMADQLTVFDLLVSARAQPCGIALTERAAGPRTRVLLRLLGIPSMIDVGGLFRWAADGDVALLDSHHGLLVINPSRADIASLRRERRPSNALEPR